MALSLVLLEKPVGAFITGFDTTLNPPAPNNSLVIEVPAGMRGGITGLVFPYSGGTPTAANDQFGGVNDGGFAWNQDNYAGAKYSVRWDPAGGGGSNGARHYGITSGGVNTGSSGLFNEVSRTETNFNVTPFGDLEAVIRMEMYQAATAGGADRPMRVVQKTILRNNNQWFGQTYRFTNESTVNYNDGGGGLWFLNGVDWNFCNNFNNDDSIYDAASDTLIGNKQAASVPGTCGAGNFVAGGFSARCTSGGCAPTWTSDVQRCANYTGVWTNMNANNGSGGCPFAGDAGTYFRWNLGALNAGSSYTFPFIWAFQINNSVANARTAVINTIQAGMPYRYNASAIDITFSPETSGNRYNSLLTANLTIGGNVGLRGFVDASVPSNVSITGPAGCTVASQAMTTVDLAIPSPESASVGTYNRTLAPCGIGTHTVNLCTNLTNDSTPADDCVSRQFTIVPFLIEPDATATDAPGNTVSYPVSTYKTSGGTQTYDFTTSGSTQGWPTELWYIGPVIGACATPPCLMASDTNGDGTWDTVTAAFDTNSNGQPDFAVNNGINNGAGAGSPNLQIRKLIPASEGLGITDTTVLTATQGSNTDDLTVTTSTTAPTPVTKTLHLHPSYQMDTFPDTQTVTSSVTVPALSTSFWQQTTAFATGFNILGAGSITAPMYIGTGGTSRSVTFNLLTVGPAGCPANIGTVTQNINTPTANPPVTNLMFTSVPTITIPANCRVTVAITNNSGGNITVYHDNQGTGHRSRVNFSTTSFVRIQTAALYTGACPGTTPVTSMAPVGAPGPTGITACVRARISDPFGAGDIGSPPGSPTNSALITVTDPYGNKICYQGIGDPSTSCNRVDNVPMNFYTSDASSRTFTFGIPVQSHHITNSSESGTYTVAMTGVESNDVTYSRSFTFFVTAATAAKLLSFEGSGYSTRADIRWLTGQEVSTLGYNLYRSDLADRGYVSVNPYLIKGLGYSAVGGSYLYADETVDPDRDYYYILEEVEESGKTHRYGPILVKTRSGIIAPPVDASYTNNYLIDIEPPTVLDPQDPDFQIPVVLPETAVLRTVESGSEPGPAENPDRSVDIEIILPEPVWSEMQIGDETYTRAQMSGLDPLFPSGAPEIPGATYLIKVPQGTFTGSEVTGIDSYLVFNRRIPPVAPLSLPESGLNTLVGVDTSSPNGPSEDALIYGSDAPFPADIVIVSPPVEIGGQRFIPVQVAGLQWNPVSGTGQVVRRITARLHFTGANETNALPEIEAALQQQWQIASRADAVRILVTDTGIQQVTGSTLASAGLQMNGPAENIRCFRRGEEIAIDVVDADLNGTFGESDGIIFYGKNDADEYRTTSAYWCLSGDTPGLRPETLNAHPDIGAPVPDGAYFLSRKKFEQDLQYFDTLNAPGEDHWFWKAVSAGAGQTGTLNGFTVEADDLNAAGALSAITVQLRGQTTSTAVPVNNHHVRIKINGTTVDDILFSNRDLITRRISFPTSLLTEGANTVGIQVIGDRISSGFDTSWVNWVELIYPRSYVMRNGRLDFTTPLPGRYEISGVSGGDPLVYDISTPERFRKLTGGMSFGGTLTLAVSGNAAKLILTASTPSGAYQPVAMPNRPSSLNNTRNKADYVAIGPAALLAAAEPLLAHRERERMWVIRARVDDVMDEFNWGDSHPLAIQKLLRHAYHRYAVAPRYALIVGDASQDARGVLSIPPQSPTAQHQTPAYLFDNPHFRAPSDAYLGLITGFDIVPDIAIGRLAGSTPEHITTQVNKIITYEATPMDAPYLKSVTLVADNATSRPEDRDIRVLTEADIASIVALNGWNPERLYLQDGATPPNLAQTTDGIVNGLNNGRLFLYYRGHGSALLWADEQIFRTASPFLPVSPSNREDWTRISNSSGLSVITTFGCLDGNFVNPYLRTMAEIAMLKPDSGVAAYLASAGLSTPPAQTAAARTFYDSVLSKGLTRVGDAMRAAIASAAGIGDSESFLLSWTLFGDPAMRLRVNHAPILSAVVPPFWSGNSGIPFNATETSDPNGDKFTLNWSLLEKPAGTTEVSIRGMSSPRAILVPGGPGLYRIRLTATDSFGASSSRDYSVLVRSLDSDSDLDGVPDTVEYLIGTLVNSVDSDGDGIDDLTEIGDVKNPFDTDGDGIIDALDPDSDGDGIPDAVEGLADTDEDGIPNFRDIDSDGDGKLDLREGTVDDDDDGIANYLDADDSDGPLGDIDQDGVLNFEETLFGSNPYHTDSDGDGIPDILEANVTVSSNPDIDGYPATAFYASSGAPDRDGDGVPDLLDTDTDGDGIPDSVEGLIDLDGDGIPNYRDLDSDNDGIPDAGLPDGTPNYYSVPAENPREPA